MEKFDLMKELGVNPFSKYLTFLDQDITIFDPENSERIKYLDFTSHDPDSVYYIYSISNFLKSTILTNLGYFLVFKLIHLLLYLLRNSS